MSSISSHRQLQDEIVRFKTLVASLAESQTRLVELLDSCPSTAAVPLAVPILRKGRSTSADLAFVDEAIFSVVQGKRRCFLGNILPYRFFMRLYRQPNLYVSYEQLLTDVWDNHFRTREAIRSVVKDLRSRLRRDQMDDVADAIDGSVAGHYALRWPVN